MGAGPVEIGVRIFGFQGDDAAVVLHRAAVVPHFAVKKSPGGQGLGIVRIGSYLFRQTLDHQAKALQAHAVHHPAELAVVLRWLPLVHAVMFPVHDSPVVSLDVPLPDWRG